MLRESMIWRELSRFPDLGQSIQGVATKLAGSFSLAGMVVARLDRTHRLLMSISDDWSPSVDAVDRWSLPKISWREPDLETFLRWHRAGKSAVGHADNVSDRRLMTLVAAPSDLQRLVLLPLRDEEHEPGLLVLVLHREGDALPRAEQLQSLIDPFSMALVNDSRFHQLHRLREAAEADKRALLSRLERQDIVPAIVGAESGLAEVMERVAQVALTDAPVLLLGETGTGKEVVARALHERSSRKKGPMVRVNCGAIPPGLVDSELFGHERGSFTGAVSAREGWFERADGGTLFLDEVAELPLEAQVRLLRVLQEGVLERVGGTRPVHVDVRIVAATHRHVEAMVAQRTFREDLWYRLSVFPIVLPPLRERRHDIPALAAHFASRSSRRLGGPALVPSPADLELLIAYHWPGNVRELGAVMERAAILGNGKFLDVAGALGTRQPASAPVPVHRTGDRGTQKFSTLDEAQREHIERALQLTRGRVEGEGGAAELLDINPHTLRGRMRKLKINWTDYRRVPDAEWAMQNK